MPYWVVPLGRLLWKSNRYAAKIVTMWHLQIWQWDVVLIIYNRFIFMNIHVCYTRSCLFILGGKYWFIRQNNGT